MSYFIAEREKLYILTFLLDRHMLYVGGEMCKETITIFINKNLLSIIGFTFIIHKKDFKNKNIF